MREEILSGKVIWIEPDKERSRVSFSPRKGIILNSIEKFPKKDAVEVELVPAPLIWSPIWSPVPHKLHRILLKYAYDDEDSIQRTFQFGLSVADVFRIKGNRTTGSTIRDQDTSRLGIAIVRPWPIPSTLGTQQHVSVR